MLVTKRHLFQVAIKCLEKRNLDTVHLNRIYREIEIMKSLEHPNIIKLNQVMESKSMLYLVCEFAENGEIFGTFKKLKKLIFLSLKLN